jgi:NTE family protein
MTISFVLAGGGSLAATQVGMLRALSEADIEPDLMVGTSAGGINAFCFAQHPTASGIVRLQELWSRMRRRDVFPIDVVQILAGLTGIRDGVVVPDKLRSFLRRQLGTARLEDSVIPTHIVATDLTDGQPVVLSEGSALDALMASTAIPGVFPPVELDERPLVDGGVSVDVPVRQAENLGSTVTYVLPTVGPGSPATVPHGAIPVLLHAVSHLFGRAAATEIDTARHQVHLLPAPAHVGANPFDFGATDELIEAGYQAVARFLAAGQDQAARLIA